MKQTQIDRDVLPTAMLDQAKADMRVRHARDDSLILSFLARAIALVERKCDVRLNPATYQIPMHHLCGKAYPAAPQYVRWRLPVNNATTIASLTDGANEVKADYTLEQADMMGSADTYLVGPPLYGAVWTLTVDVGGAVPGDIAADLQSLIYRVTAGYYENRESNSPILGDEFFAELFSSWRVGA